MRLLLPYGLAVLAGFTLACQEGVKRKANQCRSTDECDSGEVCRESLCRELCASDVDCGEPTFGCTDGVCLEVENPTCEQDADCRAPMACRRSPGECLAGQCSYQNIALGTPCNDGSNCTLNDACNDRGECIADPVVCDTPPSAPTCINNDNTYRAYLPVGTCNEMNGDCEYSAVEIDCAMCNDNCLTACNSVSCDDQNGGCQSNGVCIPGAVATCSFVDAPDRAACDRSGEPGVCSGGACVECHVAADCPGPAIGPAACFDAACISNACEYTPRAMDVCAMPTCTGGFLTYARLCGAMGACEDLGGVSCGGFKCNLAGDDCLTTCATAAECEAGLICNGTVCEGLLQNGELCSDNAVCENTCINGNCRFLSGAGGACDDAQDCQSGHDCMGGACRGTTGTSCNSNSDCVDVCIDGSCRPPATTGEDCDEGADCVSDHVCHSGTDTCRKVLGKACSDPADCDSGYCADDVCCQSACTGDCQACDFDGTCSLMPPTDPACAMVDCTSLNHSCRTYDPILANACSSFGNCATTGDCNSFTNRSASHVCRSSAGNCDVEETCDGNGSPCPSDGFESGSTVCRSSQGVCDAEETCPGNGPTCPMDAKEPGTTECRASSGMTCDVPEYCDGGNACPGQEYEMAGTVCRAETGSGCDVAEVCSGSAPSCPAQGYRPPGYQCRAGTGLCNLAETCAGGTVNCPANQFSFVNLRQCTGGTIIGSIYEIANNRSNVTAADQTACRDHCDAAVSVDCCAVYGLPAIKTFPNRVWCYAWNGGTTQAATPISGYTYMADMCE